MFFSLLVALWGRVEDVSGEENLETHDITMTRREAISKWLEEVVSPCAKRDIDKAFLNKKKVSGLIADLSRGNVSGACRGLQEAGDHRAALLAAQAGGGGEAGRLICQQLDRWTEVRADISIDKDRLRMYSLIAGTLKEVTNTAKFFCLSCSDILSWKMIELHGMAGTIWRAVS